MVLTYFRARILRWGRANHSVFPWRSTKNRWHALAAEIMLQRTRAEQVLPVYEQFCSRYENPTDYVQDREARIFSSLGLIWREREFRNLAKILSDSDIPTDRESLLELPGIGDYITSALRSLHLGVRDVIIDSNVVRIYGRFFGFETDGETRRRKRFRSLSEQMTPKRQFRDYNYGLIDFTRAICRPSPHCPDCPLRRKCVWRTRTQSSDEPLTAPECREGL